MDPIPHKQDCAKDEDFEEPPTPNNVEDHPNDFCEREPSNLPGFGDVEMKKEFISPPPEQPV